MTVRGEYLNMPVKIKLIRKIRLRPKRLHDLIELRVSAKKRCKRFIYDYEKDDFQSIFTQVLEYLKLRKADFSEVLP
jgi:hypothetical protein